MRQGRQVAYTVDDDHVRDVLRNMIAHFVEPHEHTHDPIGLETAERATSEGEDR